MAGMTRILASLKLIAAAGMFLAGPAAGFETRAAAAYVYDITTGTVLMEKNADAPLPPASMSKLMTLNMLFEALRDGRVALDTKFSVSSQAKAIGGSTMFLQETDRPTVEDLIKGIIVQSGNDACVVVAEGLAGSEAAFSRLMTERGRAIGLTASNFTNASGWPDPDHRMSVRDLGIVATRLITEFPEYYGYFSLTEYHYGGRSPENRFNRNPLLGLGIGADGLKTGHTIEAGYGIVGSALQGDRRIVFVISGLTSEKERAEESERIINWAFRQFTQKTIAKAGTRFAEVEVFMGNPGRVGMVVAQDLTLLVPALAQDAITAEAVYTAPLSAPVSAGATVGELVITLPGMAPARVPLVAETEVRRGGFFTRLSTAADAVRAMISGGES